MNELNLYSDSYSERPINLPSITQTLIHGRGKKVTKDNLIGSFENWWPTFEIKFEVKVDSFGSKPGMLLLFTANNEDCRFSCSSGQRIPAVLTSRSIKINFILIHFNTIKILIPKPWKWWHTLVQRRLSHQGASMVLRRESGMKLLSAKNSW